MISDTGSHMIFIPFFSLQGVPGAQGRTGSPGDRVGINTVGFELPAALTITLKTIFLL